MLPAALWPWGWLSL